MVYALPASPVASSLLPSPLPVFIHENKLRNAEKKAETIYLQRISFHALTGRLSAVVWVNSKSSMSVTKRVCVGSLQRFVFIHEEL